MASTEGLARALINTEELLHNDSPAFSEYEDISIPVIFESSKNLLLAIRVPESLQLAMRLQVAEKTMTVASCVLYNGLLADVHSEALKEDVEKLLYPKDISTKKQDKGDSTLSLDVDYRLLVANLSQKKNQLRRTVSSAFQKE
jgi:hypothetical protein